ncbi:hypothetical protein B0H13DRAFT_181641 [Mycena leptocephala]|nr:hypothetical protein B0H13DRAFT_181641 [Mycena leptocephala]
MSRIPQPSRGGAPRNAPPSPTKLTAPTGTPRIRTKSTVARATTPSKATFLDKPPKSTQDEAAGSSGTPRIRTKSTFARATTPSKSPRKPYADTDSFMDKVKSAPDGSPPKALSIKEAIAQKRAQAKKAQTSGGVSPLDDLSSLADAIPNPPPPEDEDILGRPSLRDTIERAKSTGSINLSTRSLQCIPSALFDIHLGITPEPLKSVPEEPPLPPAAETGPRRKRPGPAWFETQDLEILKAWGNDIVEIQPEIALFGSLKSIDLHINKIVSLPDQFADLAALTTLDLSHNAITSLPSHLFSLPALSNLNVSHNALTSLPFSAPFDSSSGKARSTARVGLFAAEITRASVPLPKLAVFDVSNNQLTAASIDLDIPKALVTLDLSSNPLEESGGSEACGKLFAALSKLAKLKVLRCEKADVSDAVLEGILHVSSSNVTPFSALSVFDLGETKVTENGARVALTSLKLKQELTFELTNEDPPAGVVRVVVGKKIVREAWEIEAERRAKLRAGGRGAAPDAGIGFPPPPGKAGQAKSGVSAKPVVKEAWEIEAEQGLLTEGGKRRARAAAAAAAAGNVDSGLGLGAPPRQTSPTKAPSLADPQYYTQRTETLVLPASAPPKVAGHSRAFSLAAPGVRDPSERARDVALPTATLPLSLIAAQPFAATLKVLTLTNRRSDRTFVLPPLPGGEGEGGLLPRLEELSLEGCNLGDSVAVAHAGAEEALTMVSSATTRALLPLIAELFPNLRTLNLAYNTLTSAALTAPILSALILSSSASDSADGRERKGLRQLHIRGNRIADLDGFRDIGLLFKGNRSVSGWGLEELDLRDNEIGKLPAEVGLLPLDVLLVDGNVFRVPARRVWEREGTKGLLSWLRGRIE